MIRRGAEKADGSGPMTVDHVASGHIRIDGRNVAIGLLWQTRTRDMSIRQQARAAAGHSTIHDLHAVVPGRAQIGFTSSAGSHRARMLVGALQIQTGDLGKTWLAAFALAAHPGPMWVVALREGDVYEDSYHETPAAAYQTYLQLAAAPDWESCIAPRFWKISEADDVPLEAVFCVKPVVRLQPIDPIAALAPRLLGAAGIGAVCAVLWAMVPDAIDRMTSEPVQVVDITSMPPPWLDKPRLADFAAACVHLIGTVYLPQLGWEMAPIVCDWQGKTLRVVAQWNHQGGRYGRLRETVAARVAAPLHLGCAGKCATLTDQVVLTRDALQSDEGSWTAARAEARLREQFHDLGLKLRMTLRHLQAPTGQNAHGVVVSYSYHDVRFDAASGLNDHLALLAAVPALVPEALTFVPATGHWQVTARIYHRESAV